jgi:hypothetical protein
LKGKLGNFVSLGGEVGTDMIIDLWGEQEVEDFFGFFDEVLGGKSISLGGKLPLHSPLGLIPGHAGTKYLVPELNPLSPQRKN